MNSFREIEERVRGAAARIDADKCFVITDVNVDALTSGLLEEYERLVLQAGEGTKTIEGAISIWEFLCDRGATRRSMVINLGGGMVSDLGGFAASTFKRGIPFVNLPTTLLAAVDAATGGKTGIDFRGLKNEVGTFAMPLEVIPLTGLFPSLTEAEWLSGCGEVLKTALLDSRELFELASDPRFMAGRERELVEEVVERCSGLKKRIVEQDFREKGLRKCLNLGHTAGHAIESLMMEKGEGVPHGIAVAYGILFALELSMKYAGLDREVYEMYEDVLRRYFPKIELDASDWRRIKDLMGHDKKNREAGKPRFVLLRDIGEPVTDVGIEPE